MVSIQRIWVISYIGFLHLEFPYNKIPVMVINLIHRNDEIWQENGCRKRLRKYGESCSEHFEESECYISFCQFCKSVERHHTEVELKSSIKNISDIIVPDYVDVCFGDRKKTMILYRILMSNYIPNGQFWSRTLRIW